VASAGFSHPDANDAVMTTDALREATRAAREEATPFVLVALGATAALAVVSLVGGWRLVGGIGPAPVP